MKCCSLLFEHLLLISVENESHCDFMKLREMLIRTNMEDMREKTHVRHYELYRKKRLEQVTNNSVVIRKVFRI
jgi:septin family protein